MADFLEISSKKLLENANIGVIIHKWDTSVVYANPTSLKLLRLSYEQIIGKDAYDPDWHFIDETGKKLLIEDFPVNKVKRTQSRLKNEVIGVIDSSSDDISWFFINAYFEGASSSPSSFIVITFTDISDSKHLFSFQQIVENAQDMVIVTEASNTKKPLGPKIIYVNPAFEKITGYKKEEAIGETPRMLQGALTDRESTNRIQRALRNYQEVNETLLNYDVKGRPYWVEMNIIPLKNKNGEVTHFASIERDVSEQKFHHEKLKKSNADLKLLKSNLAKLVDEQTLDLQKAKAKLEEMAFFDPLTNIPNRRHFVDQAYRLNKFCNRRKLHLAFGLIDIDDFKYINDTHGHNIGDAVLVALADYFKSFFRVDDAFCRYGGEEFAFAVALEDPSDISKLADRLLTGIRKLKIKLNSKEFVALTVSVGVQICDPAKEIELETELKKADILLYQAKCQGKNRCCIEGESILKSVL